MKKLIVHRRGFDVSPTTFRRQGKLIHRKGFKVSSTNFKMKDRGASGRATGNIPKLKKGTLGGQGFFSKSTQQRRRIESSLAKKIGEKRVQGKLQAIAVLNKRTNPEVMRKAQSDRSYIAGSFIGKKRVMYPRGFRRRK
jgi:hypothetical protein